MRVPRLMAPSKKVTVPVGVPVAGASDATVAVRKMFCPEEDGLNEAARLVEEEPLFTVCPRGVLLLTSKSLSPL